MNSQFKDTLSTEPKSDFVVFKQNKLQYVWNVTNQGCFSTGSAAGSFMLQRKKVHSVPPDIYIHR